MRFKHLDRFAAFRIYLYIHEYRTIPEYLNHYVHVFDTNRRGRVEIQFSRQIIFRQVHNGAACVNYGDEHKSKDHCLQSCARAFFNYNYYKFLYLEGDNVTMFSSTRSEVYPFCLKYCPIRCSTHYFEADQIQSYPTVQHQNKTKADLALLTYRNSPKDSIQNVIINAGIFTMNILTIIGFLAGFNLFALHNVLQLYVRTKYRIDRWNFASIDQFRLLFAVLKFGLLIAFISHMTAVFRECRKCETFQTVIARKNVFVENITVTFCFELKHLIDPEMANRTLVLQTYYLNEALSSPIYEVFTKLEIYTRDFFHNDRQKLDDFLRRHSELIFYEDKKCFKLNLNLPGPTGIYMNINLVKYSTLDNYARFVFARPYASVYLSEYSLYPNLNNSFRNRKFFRKFITIYSESFHGKRCLNYSLEPQLKCGSKLECIVDCLVREVLKKHNTYPTQFKYLPKYKQEFKSEFNITEETVFKHFDISAKLRAYCKKKFPMRNCRKVVFKTIRSVIVLFLELFSFNLKVNNDLNDFNSYL